MDAVHAPEERRFAVTWGVPLTLGILMIVTGALALFATVLTTLVSVLYIGVMLLLVGVFEMVAAFRVRHSSRFLVYLLAGLLAIVVGALFLYRPLISLASVTLLIAGYVFASGMFRGITSAIERYPRWGWDLVYAGVAVALGALVIASWPLSSFVVLGTVVGIEILFRGVTLVAAAMVLREAAHAGTPGEPAPA